MAGSGVCAFDHKRLVELAVACQPTRLYGRCMKLSGRSVLVTGASSGIGAEIARELVRRGASPTLVAGPAY